IKRKAHVKQSFSLDFLERGTFTEYPKVDRNGFHYQAVLAIPESSVYSIAEIEVGFDGKLTITSTK
uniref:DUF4738 domain-containing protein n=1 Tax=Bacteroides finegoldii TaxID=338188 RepID=UPI0035675C5D